MILYYILFLYKVKNEIVVIGAGLPRTGTASLRTALSSLLNGPIYHMHEVIQNGSKDMEFWNQARTSLGMDGTLNFDCYSLGEFFLA